MINPINKGRALSRPNPKQNLGSIGSDQRFEEILRSTNARKSGGQWLGHCPSHDDHNPSLSLNLTSEGKILVKCHSGCSQISVLGALGMQSTDSTGQREPQEPHVRQNKSTVYPAYTDRNGNPVLQVERIDSADGSKRFIQRHLENGGWVCGGPKDKSVLAPYRWLEWKETEQVVLTEGEKCADALWAIGIHATTTPGGASSWKDHFAPFFAGKTVVILPDADEPGRKYTASAKASLQSIATSVSVLELPGLASGEDVFDWLQKGGTQEELEKLISSFDPSSKTDAPFIQCLADVETKSIDWAWKDRIPFGAITLIGGLGGSGKSSAMAAICADLTRGRPLPGDEAKDPLNVLLLAVEDDPSSVLRPRFEAHDADLSRVFFRDQVVMFNEPTLNLLREIVDTYSIRFIVIDPIVSYLNGKDANKAGEVRALLNPLAELARDKQCAVVIIAHFNKSDSSSASNRISGSSDFRNAARSALQVTKTDDQAFIALEKSNYAARAKTLKFRIQDSRVVWQGESDLSADQVLAEASESSRDGGVMDAAIDFLETELANGPIESKLLKHNAESAGISERTLNRARAKLNVRAFKIADKWMTEIPANQEGQASQPQTLGTVGPLGSVPRVKNDLINSDVHEESQECQEGQDSSGGETGLLDQGDFFEEVV